MSAATASHDTAFSSSLTYSRATRARQATSRQPLRPIDAAPGWPRRD
ncbi:hypothetical protein [Salinisphaera sp. T5B8]